MALFINEKIYYLADEENIDRAMEEIYETREIQVVPFDESLHITSDNTRIIYQGEQAIFEYDENLALDPLNKPLHLASLYTLACICVWLEAKNNRAFWHVQGKDHHLDFDEAIKKFSSTQNLKVMLLGGINEKASKITLRYILQQLISCSAFIKLEAQKVIKTNRYYPVLSTVFLRDRMLEEASRLYAFWYREDLDLKKFADLKSSFFLNNESTLSENDLITIILFLGHAAPYELDPGYMKQKEAVYKRLIPDKSHFIPVIMNVFTKQGYELLTPEGSELRSRGTTEIYNIAINLATRKVHSISYHIDTPYKALRYYNILERDANSKFFLAYDGQQYHAPQLRTDYLDKLECFRPVMVKGIFSEEDAIKLLILLLTNRLLVKQVKLLFPAELTRLNVSHTRITDDLLKAILDRCPRLENIAIDNCKLLTDAGKALIAERKAQLKSTKAATLIQSRWRGYRVRKLKINPPQVTSPSHLLPYVISNEPQVLLPETIKLKEYFVMVGTSTLANLFWLKESIVNPTLLKDGCIPKLYIVDYCSNVKTFWMMLKKIIAHAETLQSFEKSVLEAKDPLQALCQGAGDRAARDIIYGFDLLVNEGNSTNITAAQWYNYFRNVIGNATIICDDWANPAVFEYIKSWTQSHVPIVVYASNIIEYVGYNNIRISAMEERKAHVEKIINNIETLGPKYTIHMRTSMKRLSALNQCGEDFPFPDWPVLLIGKAPSQEALNHERYTPILRDPDLKIKLRK